jgi:hypothetical protein
MFGKKHLIDGILVIMHGCWDPPPDLDENELEHYATELLKRIQAGDPKIALDEYLSNVQANRLQLPKGNEFSEIVDRSRSLVNACGDRGLPPRPRSSRATTWRRT